LACRATYGADLKADARRTEPGLRLAAVGGTSASRRLGGWAILNIGVDNLPKIRRALKGRV
jgi:hypothetical protein